MNEIPSPQAGTYLVRVDGATAYVLNADGMNRWTAQVQPGYNDAGKRVSDAECQSIARRIAAALAGPGTASAPLSPDEFCRVTTALLDHVGEPLADKVVEILTAPGAAAAAPAIAQPYTLAEIEAKIASHDYNAELLLQHAMLLLSAAHGAAAPALLFEHEDGRYAVNPDTTGDPGWRRLGPVELPADAAAAAPADAERLDWLETMVVNVRQPLRYGSHDRFWASPAEVDGGPDGPSDIRKQIDAARTAQQGAKA